MRIHRDIFSSFRDDIVKYIRDELMDIDDWHTNGKPWVLHSRKWWEFRVTDDKKKPIYVGLKIYGRFSSQVSIYDRILDEIYGKISREDDGYADLRATNLAVVLAGLNVLVNSNFNTRSQDFYLTHQNDLENDTRELLGQYLKKNDYDHLVSLFDKAYLTTKPDHQKLSTDENKPSSELLTDDRFPKGISSTTYLNLIPKLYDDMIGREPELSQLHELMNGTNKIVLLNGVGGIGKTTLAKKYLHDNKHNFKNIAWVSLTASDNNSRQQSDENFMSAFTQDKILVEQGLNLQFETDTPVDKMFRAIMYQLQKLSGPNLLVIDNAEANVNRFREELPLPPEWQLLVTSRANIIGLEPFRLENLDEAHSIKLFKKWFKKEFEITELKKLLAIVDYHTLMIELLAKTLTANLGLLSVNDLIAKLENKALDDHLLQDLVATAHNKEDDTLLKHLLRTFELSNLKPGELNALKCFYFLPPEYYSAEFLTEMFGKEADKEFIPSLKTLYHKGWLQYDGEKFHMHRLIQTVIYYALSPTSEFARTYINKLTKLTENIESNTLESKMIYLPYTSFLISQLLEFISHDRDLAVLCINLGITYKQARQYEKADTAYDRAIGYFEKDDEAISAFDRHILSICYIGKASVAGQYKRKDNAQFYLTKALTISEDPTGVSEEMYLHTYHDSLLNLGLHYEQCRQYEKAGSNYYQASTLSEKLYTIDSERYFRLYVDTLIRLSNNLLINNKNYEAKKFAKKVVSLSREQVKKNKIFALTLAKGLVALAQINHKISGDIDDAIANFEESISICQVFVKLNETVHSKFLADIYWDYGEILEKSNLLPAAELQYNESETLLKKLLKHDRSAFIYPYCLIVIRLGNVLNKQGKDGVRYLNIAQDLTMEMFENGYELADEFFYTDVLIGEHYISKGDFLSAVRYLENGKKHYIESVDDQYFKQISVLILAYLARCYDKLGNVILAVDNQEDCYNLCIELFEDDIIEVEAVIEAAIHLKGYYIKNNDQENAKEVLKTIFKLMHHYENNVNEGNTHDTLVNEVESLFGLSFEDWFDKEVLST